MQRGYALYINSTRTCARVLDDDDGADALAYLPAQGRWPAAFHIFVRSQNSSAPLIITSGVVVGEGGGGRRRGNATLATARARLAMCLACAHVAETCGSLLCVYVNLRAGVR